MFMHFEHALLLKYFLVITLCLITVNKLQVCLSHQLVQASWDDSNNDGKLLHLTINENTGQVYVGAVNKIYQLSSDLKLEAHVTMGPMPDDVKCPASRDCPQFDKKVMDYYNKALVVFDQSQLQSTYNSAPSFLVSCGSLFQGACALHPLSNITQYTLPANESLVANSPNATTVVFIAPGPTEPHQSRQLPVLYIASSYTGLGPYNQEVPAISSRSLSPDSIFALAANNVASGTRLTINSLARDRYPISYVHGFSSKGFSFFVTVQRLSTTSPKPFITKLVRICQKDTNYHSYIEVPLSCKSQISSNQTEEIDFNLAQAAFVAKPGSFLARDFLISTQDEVLFIVFAKSKDSLDTFNEPSQQSALCLYPLKQIHTMITANIQQCFNGNGQQGLDFVSSTVACEKSQWPITDDFCGTDMNNPISGIFPIESNPVISYNDVLLTSVAVNEASTDFTVAYLGTSNGRLKRVVIENDRTAVQYMDAPVDLTSNSPINPDMRFDRSGNFLYLMNEKKVFLVKTHDCLQFKNQFDCINEKDPHCGWCSIENKCSIKNSCSQAQQDSEYWISYKTQVSPDYSAKQSGFNFVSPSISSISPSKGPVSGGTKLHIFGTYLSSSPKVEVFVGSYPCTVTNQLPNHIDCITSPASKAGGQAVTIRFDSVDLTFPDYHFLYVDDPEIESVTSAFSFNAPLTKNSIQALPPRGIPAGGIKIHVKGRNLNCIQESIFYVVLEGIKYKGSCQKESETEMSCLSPKVPEERLGPFRIAEEPVELDYGFIMDNVKSVHNLATRVENKFPMFLMYSNPEYKPFPEEVKLYKSDYLTINGSNLDRASSEYDVKVSIGDSFCNVTSLSRNQLTCRPPSSQPAALVMMGQHSRNQLPDVVVTVGDSLNFTIGKISYDNSASLHNLLTKPMLYVLMAGAVILLFLVIAVMVAYEKKRSESNRAVQTMQEQMDVLEMKVASEAKQAFTELQTEMTDLTDDLEHGGIPYLEYRIYAMKVLFPNQSDHQVLNEVKIDPTLRVNFDKGINQFRQLILNKTFLILFIRTLESNKYFSMRDRVNVASLIMVTLQNKMEYCTDILKTLLADLIERTIENRSHPKLLLRRTESVVEKMLSSWFLFLLNKFIRECAGEPLFLLYQAIKHQVNKGPVDAITSEARCSLSEEKLIRQSVDYKSISLNISINAQTAYLSGVDPNTLLENIDINVKVLDCDTISQVKDKAIDALYKSTPFSQRPHRDSFDLEWRPAPSSKPINLSDQDHTTKTEGYWRKLNTLAHYRVPDGASLMLVARQNSIYNMPILGNNVKNHYETLNFNFIKPNMPPNSPLNEMNNGYKYWHLVRHHDNDYRDGERSAKMVSEIYLTRLLATKGTLQRFVDDLFETIFSTARLTSSLPIAIKYMFDFLDDQAREHGIIDPEVVHTWKSNCLPLRFWVNLIKNPDFVFDIDKSNIVDACLSVVAQTFMDACSTSEHRLGKDSPSSKLLYAKDLPIYKDWVERYYNEIAMMPPINEHDMNAMLAEESRQHAHEFNTIVSLHELYKYAVKYQDQLFQTLDNDEFANKFMLSAKLRQTILLIDGCDSNLYVS